MRCTPDQIVLTAGTQGALDLAARTLLDPGEAAWLENPGYFGAQGALLAAGARLVPVPVDEQGLDVEIGRRRCPEARLVLTAPSHQFPTGVTMSLGRRLALLDWAKEAGAWILEDDYDSEYRFGGRPLEALQGLDHAGTGASTSAPSARCSSRRCAWATWSRRPNLIEPLLATRRFIDVHMPILEQLALTDFMHRGALRPPPAPDAPALSAGGAICLHRELRAHLGGLLDVYLPEAGMHLVGWLPPGKDDRRAAELAAEAGVQVVPISRSSLEPLHAWRTGLRLRRRQ